jgi:hypothetical protein
MTFFKSKIIFGNNISCNFLNLHYYILFIKFISKACRGNSVVEYLKYNLKTDDFNPPVSTKKTEKLAKLKFQLNTLLKCEYFDT